MLQPVVALFNAMEKIPLPSLLKNLGAVCFILIEIFELSRYMAEGVLIKHGEASWVLKVGADFI